MEPDVPLDLYPCPADAPDGAAEAFRPEWRTETVVGLANGIADACAFERMPILADALEEAGCTDQVLLRHCREPSDHENDCWALMLLLRETSPLPSPRPAVEWRRLAEVEASAARLRFTPRQRLREFVRLTALSVPAVCALYLLCQFVTDPVRAFQWAVVGDAAVAGVGFGLMLGVFFGLARWLSGQ